MTQRKKTQYDCIAISPNKTHTLRQGLGVTEQTSLHTNLDKKSVGQLLIEMNEEDQKVALAVQKCISEIELVVKEVVERMKKGGRLFYIGAGTSGRLGVLDASEIPPTFGMSSDRVIGLIAGGEMAIRKPVENAEDDKTKGWEELLKYHINANDAVVGIAASGTTPYVIYALRNARANGVFTACITCNPHSPMAQESDVRIEVIVGPEFVTGSTRLKSGTAQKLVLNMISTTTMIQLGRVKGNKMVNMQLSNAKLRERAVRILEEELQIDNDCALQLLIEHGSLQKVFEAISKQKSETD